MIWTFHWRPSGYRECVGLNMITHRDRQETHTKWYPGTLKTTLWRTGRNLKDNIKIDHKNCVEVEWTGIFFGLRRGKFEVLYDCAWCWSYGYHIKKVKESRNRPDVAQRVSGALGSQISMTFGTWRWWGYQPHAPATFTPRKCSWNWVDPRAMVRSEGIRQSKIQWHYRESIPTPSD
jgi:hypothetical protein